MPINFASENFAGVHPAMMEALANANTGAAPSYGNDAYTAEAVAAIKNAFGDNVDVYFTFNGTGANNFGIGAVAERYHSVFCSDVAHLYVDESTAPESFIGCRLYPVLSENGKIIPGELQQAIKRSGDIHHPQPGVVSITQPTEYGTVYTAAELKVIKEICQQNQLLLHVDGARYFNAADALGLSLKTMTTDIGIDILTLGGTKAGMMFGEAVLFFSQETTPRRRYHLKRSMQLASKNRFIAAQFTAMLKDGIWQKIAAHTNGLAKMLAERLPVIPGVKLSRPVETNVVFLNMPPQLHQKLQPDVSFYYWDELREEARLVFSFDNTVDEVETFLRLLTAV